MRSIEQKNGKFYYLKLVKDRIYILVIESTIASLPKLTPYYLDLFKLAKSISVVDFGKFTDIFLVKFIPCEARTILSIVKSGDSKRQTHRKSYELTPNL